MKKEFEKTTTNIFSSVSSLFGVYWMTKYKFLLKEKNDLLEDNEFLERENSRYKSLIWFLYVIIFIAFLFLAIPSRASADYDSSLVHLWNFENTVIDVINSVTFPVPTYRKDDLTDNSTLARLNGSWGYNGRYSIDNGDALSSNINYVVSDEGYTLAGWIAYGGKRLSFKLKNGNDTWFYAFNLGSVIDNPTIDLNGTRVWTGSEPLYNTYGSGWLFIAMTINSEEVSVYVNGELLTSFENQLSESVWKTNGVKLVAISFFNWTTPTFRQVDDISFWNKALIEDDLLAIYNYNSEDDLYKMPIDEDFRLPVESPFEIDWLGVGSQYFDTNFTTMLPVRYNYCNLDSSNTWHGLFFKMYKSGDTVETGYSPQGLNYEVNECSGMLELPISFVGYNVNENLIDYFSGYEGEIDLIASFDSADSATTSLTTFNSVFSSHNLSEGGYISPLFYRLDKNNIKNVNIKTVLEYETATSTEPNSLNYYIESASGYNTSASSSLDLVLYYRLPSLDNLSSSTRICLVGNHSYCSDVLTGMSATTSIPLIDIVSQADVRSNFSANSAFEFVDVVNTVSTPNFYYSVPFKVNYLFSITYLDKSIPDGSDGGFIANLINSLNDRLDGLFPFSLINLFKDAWLNPNTEFTGGLVFFDRYFNESDDLVLPLPAKFVEISNGSSSVPIISANMFSESEEITSAFAMIKDVLSVIFYLVYAVFLYYLGKKTYKLLITRA